MGADKHSAVCHRLCSLFAGISLLSAKEQLGLNEKEKQIFCHMPAVKTGFTMSYFLLALNKELQSDGENNII